MIVPEDELEMLDEHRRAMGMLKLMLDTNIRTKA